jgi:hypothetical protein
MSQRAVGFGCSGVLIWDSAVIVYERFQWEPGEVYYFRSHYGRTPICEVAKCGDWWLLYFYRGAANPGPYWYRSFQKAKAQVCRYLESRESRLAGPPIKGMGIADETAPICPSSHTRRSDDLPPLQTTHPSRRPRRKEWWKAT